jgi:hypothetical protein
MKKLVLVTILFISGLAKAQGPGYDDLQILYADGNYDKLIKTSEGYTQKSKSEKDALPWFWLGRGLYKVSQSGTDEERYKNAYKDAIGAIGKAIKLDKTGDLRREQAEFIEEFKLSVVEMISNDASLPDFKKASSWVLKYYKFDANSVGAKYMEGACKFRNGDKGGANTMWKEAEKKLAAVDDNTIQSWDKADKELLKLGVIHTAECYIATRQVDKAKTLLGKVAQWYEDDEEFKAKYDEIVN